VTQKTVHLIVGDPLKRGDDEVGRGVRGSAATVQRRV